MIRYQRSGELFNKAQVYLPGGVNSPVRAFKGVEGTPLFIKKAQGAYLWDEDGHRYIDYINSWGPMILGHSYPPVIKALKNQLEKGTSFGAPTELETDIAAFIVENVPNIDQIRMVNSGTEACMSALRLARAYTNREKVIKFIGGYHGHADAFLVMAGSGVATFGIPDSLGVTQGAAKDTLLARYNHLEDVESIIKQQQGAIAAVIVEPVAGNMGCIPPEPRFLEGLRKLCDQSGALLIFDEVMTGFRLAMGGAQEYFNIAADIVTFGKIIGGGLPVGAFAARREIMSYLAPEGPVYQAGTLSGNPLAMQAGFALLKSMSQETQLFERLHKKTQYLHQGLEKAFQSANIPYCINRCGSMICVFFTPYRVKDFHEALQTDKEIFKKFFRSLLKRGIYLPPSAFESWFVSDSVTFEDLDFTLERVEEACREILQ